MSQTTFSKRVEIIIHGRGEFPRTTIIKDEEAMASFKFDQYGVFWTVETKVEEPFINRGGANVQNFTSEVRRIPWQAIDNYLVVVEGQRNV